MSEDLEELLQRGFRFALSLTHNETEAEDVLQDACVKVLRAKGPWHHGYLFPAIRSALIDRKRKQGQAVMESLETAGPEDAMGELDASWRILERAEIERSLERLRMEEREVLYLAAVEGCTAAEIAEVTGRPRGTVLSLIHRGRKKLVAYLDQSEAGRAE